MEAPQYRKGLFLHAYGTGMTGDLHELNILNHYIGMPAVEAPAFETAMFPIGIAVLVGLCLLVAAAPLASARSRLPATLLTPLVHPRGSAVAALRLRPHAQPDRADPAEALHAAGHRRNPHGQLRVARDGVVGLLLLRRRGLLLLLLAHGSTPRRGTHARRPVRRPTTAVAAMVAALSCCPPRQGRPQQRVSLQARLDAAPRGSTLQIESGVHQGPVVIRGPLSVIGSAGRDHRRRSGLGSVVTIEGDDVVFRGFTVRNSGRQVTEEAAGIKVTGNRHRIEANTVTDVYFGIHIGARQPVRSSRTTSSRPGQSHGARPGHGISAWNLHDSQLLRNRISDARDGIYLSFTERVVVASNVVTGCRYGLHSMYSQNARFENNEATGNLLGAALMMSDRLVLRGNRIQQHREGSAAYGILLKDIGDLVAEDNQILANRVGIYAEGGAVEPVAPGGLRAQRDRRQRGRAGAPEQRRADDDGQPDRRQPHGRPAARQAAVRRRCAGRRTAAATRGASIAASMRTATASATSPTRCTTRWTRWCGAIRSSRRFSTRPRTSRSRPRRGCSRSTGRRRSSSTVIR